MDTYTTKTTERGDQTYLFLGAATAAVFHGPDHAEEAALAARLLNENLTERSASALVAEKWPP
jgi:hypothetical protein